MNLETEFPYRFDVCVPAVLSSGRQDELVAQAKLITDQVFSGVDEDDVRRHVIGSDDRLELLAVRDESGALIAFSSFRRLEVEGVPVIYRIGTAISLPHHGKGVYREIVRRVHGGGTGAMFLTTQNPNIVRGVIASGVFSEVYPSFDSGVPEKALRIADALASLPSEAAFIERSSLIVRNRYENPLFKERPQCKDARIAAFFDGIRPCDAVALVAFH